MFKMLFLIWISVGLTGAVALAEKSAILLIGDGMGPTVISATRMHFHGAQGRLFLDKTRHRGLVTTYSRNELATDSAAAATAMATGRKVDNKALSWLPSSSSSKLVSFLKTAILGREEGRKLKTILELAAEQGKSVGLITNVEFTHATPAAFYAHVKLRGNIPGIVESLLKSPVDLIFGGGVKNMEMHRKKLSSKFHIVTDMKKLKKLKCQLDQPLLGSFFGDRFPYIADVKNKEPRKDALKELTQFAIDCLSKNKKGYFLMVEGGLIDQALHQRDVCRAIHETREFDELAEFVVNRVDKKKTLVLATADHDTGGLSINGYQWGAREFFTKKPCWEGKVMKASYYKDSKYRYEALRHSTDGLLPPFMARDDRDLKKTFEKAAHTAHDVDLFAWGMGAEKVYGLKDNTFIFQQLKEAMEL